ncbi:MAG: HAMP domain-containing sensor histidine kinase, partial [Gemmatimonadaceae bacterium]
EQVRLLRFFMRLPAVLGLLVVAIGVLELVLWTAVFDAPTGVSEGPLRMMPMTAICFVLSGIGLTAGQYGHRPLLRWAARILAGVVAFISLVALLDYALSHAPEMGRVRDGLVGTLLIAGNWQGMAINSAAAFVSFSQGLVLLEGDKKNNRMRSQYFATLALLISFLALVGHLFGVRDFYAFQVLSGMALSSAITFTLLAIGLLFSQIQRGVPALIVDNGAAGFVARRLVPGAVFVPLILTTLRFTGEERDLFGAMLGASLYAVADIVVFLLLIAWSARVLREIDRKRRELFILERDAHEASERARSEAELARTQAEAARTEAERANGAKSDFLAVMSHELRTPLAAIMGYQELLADGITGPVTEAQGQQLARIKASARHLLSLIDEILTFTRLDAGRETIRSETFDLDEVVRDACEIAEPLAGARKLKLRVVSPGAGRTVESDPTKVKQIVVNLLSNAVKFTDRGTVTVEASIRNTEFMLRVSDTGIGIEEEHLNKIFDPFWQVEQKATRRAQGTGLGLTVTKRLANLLGGDVAVTSRPGEGTMFTVTLPNQVPQLVSTPDREPRLMAG